MMAVASAQRCPGGAGILPIGVSRKFQIHKDLNHTVAGCRLGVRDLLKYSQSRLITPVRRRSQ